MKGQQYQKEHSKGKDLRHDPHHGWPPLFMLKNTKHEMQKWKGMTSSFIGAIRRLCHYAASFWRWTMQQHSSIYYWPPDKNAHCHRKATPKHKTRDNIWKRKEPAPIENGTNKSSRKNTRTWKCGCFCWQDSFNAWNLEVPLGPSCFVFSSPTFK